MLDMKKYDICLCNIIMIVTLDFSFQPLRCLILGKLNNNTSNINLAYRLLSLVLQNDNDIRGAVIL